MDSVKPSSTTNTSGLVRNFTKVLGFRTSDRIKKIKFQDKPRKDSVLIVKGSDSFEQDEDEKVRTQASIEALLSKLFASVSSIKASYAQLQTSQTPYNPDGVQLADELVINELKVLSELKQSYLKKTIDPNPQITQLMAEIQEQQSLLKTYIIMGKNFESHLNLQDSEITSLKDELEESDNLNRLIQKRLNPTGHLSVLDDLHFSGLNPTHFITVFRLTIKSIRSFTRLMIEKMESSRWDIDLAVESIEPGSIYHMDNHKYFTFESFVSRVMFDGFQNPNFSKESHTEQKIEFFQTFMKLKSKTPLEILKLHSEFGKFLNMKYFDVVHQKMELSFFGDLNHRKLINSGKYPETKFFNIFSEMAKMIWILNYLAFSFHPQALIFQVRKDCRFSEVFMENVVENGFHQTHIDNPRVSFTVFPGFKIGKTVIQSQVYLSMEPNYNSEDIRIQGEKMKNLTC